MAVARSRSQNLGSSIGTYRTSYGSTVVYTRQNGDLTCKDMVQAFGEDNMFDLGRVERKGGLLDGSRKWAFGVPGIWDKVPYDLYYPTTAITPTESEANSAVRAFNNTNPGRPEILLPEFIQGIRDIPRMIRQAGDTVRYVRNGIKRPSITVASSLNRAKKAAADNLAYQFGWKPLFSDLLALVDFSASVARRKKEIERLHSGRGLKRRLKLDDRETVTPNPNSLYIWSTDGTLLWYPPGSVKTTSFGRRWATLRFKPTANSPLPDQEDWIRLMMTGLTLNSLATNLWELIPWSWLVDYFTNIGDLVEYANNSAHVQCVSCCVMSHYGTTLQAPGAEWQFPSWPSGIDVIVASPYSWTVETKLRFKGLTSAPSIELGIPLLGGSQLSILGSIAVMQAGKR